MMRRSVRPRVTRSRMADDEDARLEWSRGFQYHLRAVCCLFSGSTSEARVLVFSSVNDFHNSNHNNSSI